MNGALLQRLTSWQGISDLIDFCNCTSIRVNKFLTYDLQSFVIVLDDDFLVSLHVSLCVSLHMQMITQTQITNQPINLRDVQRIKKEMRASIASTLHEPNI